MALPLKVALLKCCVPALCMQTVFLESGFSLFLPHISVSLSLFHAPHYIFLFCHCIFWGSNLLRPVVSSVCVLKDVALDAGPLWSVGLVHFKACCPWCNFALHLQVTECFPLDVHIQDIQMNIYVYIHTDTPTHAVGC